MKYLAPICRALAVQPWQVIPFSSQAGTGRDAVLDLIDVACDAGDERARTDRIECLEIKLLDVAEEIAAETRGSFSGRTGGEVLGSDAAGEADESQGDEEKTLADDIGPVISADADVDNAGDDERDEEIEKCFQHFKERGEDRLLLIIFQLS